MPGSLTLLGAGGRSRPPEDFLTYTEVDASGRLTVTASTVTATNLTRNVDAYVYKDFGAGHFNSLNIDFEFYIDSNSVTNGLFGMGLTVSTVNDSAAWGSSDVGFRMTGDTGIQLVRGVYAASDAGSVTVNTLYYATLKRIASSDTIICEIYSDAARTTLVDTLSVSGFGTGTTYRYLYAAASYNDANASRQDGYVQNMIIN